MARAVSDFLSIRLRYASWTHRLEAIKEAYNGMLAKEKKDGTKSEL